MNKEIRDLANVVLYDKNLRMLIQQRTDDDLYNPDKWAIFGGGIDEGEDPLAGAIRETMEEIEYNAQNLELVASYEYETDRRTGTRHVYTEFCTNKKDIVLHEGQGMAWVTLEEAACFPMKDIDREVIEIVDNYLKNT